MRVVGGEARGRPLRAPAGRSTRPTSDRVREAIFDILVALVDLDEARVADLFAGSGALGIEALSRGASHVTLVDDDPMALAAVRGNLAAVGFPEGKRATVVRADVLRWVRSPSAGRFDVVLADPPYRWDGWSALGDALVERTALLVAESGTEVDVGDRWSLVRRRRYGATVVTVARPAAPGSLTEPPVELKGRR